MRELGRSEGMPRAKGKLVFLLEAREHALLLCLLPDWQVIVDILRELGRSEGDPWAYQGKVQSLLRKAAAQQRGRVPRGEILLEIAKWQLGADDQDAALETLQS